jgi:cystathionine gamma-synthase
MDAPTHGFSTRAIHAGQEPDPSTGAVITPIYQVSTYKQDGVGGLRRGYEYSRSANPTRTALEECFAALEGGARGLAFASGLAAQDTLLRALLEPGDHLVVPDDAYGGTYRLVNAVLRPWGVDHDSVPVADVDAVRAAVRPGRTRVVWVETPTNPLLGIADVAAIAEVAHEAGALLVVDNTFASPYLQSPLALGADVVTHSSTKYAGGHSDVVGGVVVVGDGVRAGWLDDGAGFGGGDVAERVAYHQNAMGAVAGPFDAWLVLRGLKTLAVRMERHCDNAERVVDFLTGHPGVTAVHYPGLPEHPGHAVAARQMRRFGGMVSFRVRGGEDVAVKVCAETRIWTLAESLGGIESLIEHPGRMTHASVAGTALEVPSDLVRLSVGIEDAEDLVADLGQALDRLT